MLHYINQLFTKKNTIEFKPTIHIVRFTNLITYLIIQFFVRIYNTYTRSFQIKIAQLYCVLLQTNKISVNILPDFMKNLILTLNFEMSPLFTDKLKHYKDIYINRQIKYPLFHKFWTLFIANKIKYYNEMNIVKCNDTEIANHYYNTRVENFKFNTLFLYFFNKIIIVKYPYIYWRYYNNYISSIDGLKSSTHARTTIFFFVLNTLLDYKYSNNMSFIKTTFKTFKGVSNFFKLDSITPVFSTTKSSREIIFEKISPNVVTNKMLLKAYTVLNEAVYPHHLLNLIANNYKLYTNRTYMLTPNSLKDTVAGLTLFWYNKIHNTTINVSNQTLVLYLRAARHFNKGRYSRNRQLYRTGVYWCIWLNVVIVYALHYYFYRVVFAFGYLWIPFCIMILSIFSSRLYKYRYYSINQVIVEFKEYLNFLYFFILKFNVYKITVISSIKTKISDFFKTYWSLVLSYLEFLTSTLKNIFK